MKGALASVLLIAVLGACDETIVHELDESQANDAVVVLREEGIEASKVRDGTSWGVTVAGKSGPRALSALQRSRVIRREARTPPDAAKSLIPAREEREYARERRLAWNLERTLERFPGVIEARVHLALEPVEAIQNLSQPHRQAASVLLVVNDVLRPDDRQVRELISGASGVPQDAIAVITAFTEERKKEETQERMPGAEKRWLVPAAGAAAAIAFVLLFLIGRRKRVKITADVAAIQVIEETEPEGRR